MSKMRVCRALFDLIEPVIRVAGGRASKNENGVPGLTSSGHGVSARHLCVHEMPLGSKSVMQAMNTAHEEKRQTQAPDLIVTSYSSLIDQKTIFSRRLT
jgi:hypothetical protein